MTAKFRGKVFPVNDCESIKKKFISNRLRVFSEKGTSCVKCGIQGDFYALERHQETHRWHIRLYAVNQMGHQILMTQDHIFPKSKGGSNQLSNLQPMCYPCNQKKSNKVQKVSNE